MARRVRAGPVESQRRRRRLQGRLRQSDGGGLDSRVHGPIDDILRIFAAAAADLEYATTDAADELLNLAQGFHF